MDRKQFQKSYCKPDVGESKEDQGFKASLGYMVRLCQWQSSCLTHTQGPGFDLQHHIKQNKATPRPPNIIVSRKEDLALP